MPFIGGRYYMNPAYARGVERARAAEAERKASGLSENAADPAVPDDGSQGSHWVTMDGRHALIQEGRDGQPSQHGKPTSPRPSSRDKAYLDKYYDAVKALAARYNVDPILVLGLGAESGFATKGTNLRTGDAFGMTGGSTKHMTTATSPAQNVSQFFQSWGNQIRGTGSDTEAFLNGLQGLDASGQRVPGWKVYNTDKSEDWRAMMSDGVKQMKRAVPAYLSERSKGRGHQ
jgi:hypothetical protein